MQIICPVNKLLNKILGRQKVQKSVKYRMLRYCVSVQTPYGIAVYNTFTREIVLLNEKEGNALHSLPIENTETIELLIEHWFLVPVENKDEELCRQMREIMLPLQYTSGIQQYTILPTTDCNARCFYCYEAGCKKVTMSVQTAHHVADYIEQNCDNQPVILEWFGGEPLVNNSVIDVICNDLSNKKIEYSSIMTSNGFLFDTKMISSAKELWNLRRVQIPLDGTEAVYNKTKAYVHAKGNPYEKVITQITELLKAEIRVNVRLNVSETNVEDLMALCDELNEHFGRYDIFHVYAEKLFENKGFSPRKRTSIAEHNLYQAFFAVEDKLRDLNIIWNERVKEYYPTCSCTADRSSAIVINPDGTLRKCGCLLDSKPVGDIYSPKMDELAVAYWTEKKTEEEICKNCKFYPECILLEYCPVRHSGACQSDFVERRERKATRIIENYLKDYINQERQEI